MQDLHHLTDDQARWLKTILESRPNKSLFDRLPIPEDVRDVLVEKGLVRHWRNGDVEITLAGMVEVAHRLAPSH
jgi:hypothetical protein